MNLIKSNPVQSRGEEIANSLSHLIGLIAAITASPILISKTLNDAPSLLVAVCLFTSSMIILYLASSLYHAIPFSRAKRVFKTVDHCAIFLLIAGTYAPFTLGVLQGTLGWILFGLSWSIALIGISLKAWSKLNRPMISTGLYLGMGWMIIFAIKPLYQNLSSVGLSWLIAGGLAYTIGVIFYVLSGRIRYSHFIWHLFVIAGTSCHYAAIYYAAL